MYKSTRFTVRPKIQKGESLFGFLLRCSNANGVTLNEFINKFKIKKYGLHSGDYHKLDIIPEGIIDLTRLSCATGNLREKINSSTCSNIILKFKGSSKDYNSMFLKEYLRKDLHYCPECLKEKRILRLMWKFEPILICEKHQIPLMNCCHYCHSKIKYKDLERVSICPYCLKDISKYDYSGKKSDVPTQMLLDQTWYEAAFDTLLNKYPDLHFHQSELAMSLLYVLNDCKNKFNRKEVSYKIKEASLVHFLQCARGTTKKNTIHIRSILRILKEHELDVDTLLKLETPNEFKQSILGHDVKEKLSLRCKAPWCVNYGLEGKLLATSSKNVLYHGQTLKQYLICPDCGCEYGLSSDNGLIERTYFIRAFEILTNKDIDNLTWPEKEKIFGLKRNRILRIIAYFSSRGIFNGNYRYSERDVNDGLLLTAIESIQAGLKIHDIQRLNCWEDDEHYLLHRYHSKVIRTLISEKYSLSLRLNYDIDLSLKIKNVCDELIMVDSVIKIDSVAKKIGCSATTIRNKGCSSVINEYRQQQQVIYKKKLIQRVQDRVTKYFMGRKGEIISSKELFEELEVYRNTIKRIDPEYCKQIDQIRLSWNEQARLNM